MTPDVVDAQVLPTGRFETLSRAESATLLDRSGGGLHQLFRNCALAVLNCGNELDDGKELLERYPSFSIQLISRERGIKLDISEAPATAFVDGKMIIGIQEHQFKSGAGANIQPEHIACPPRRFAAQWGMSHTDQVNSGNLVEVEMVGL